MTRPKSVKARLALIKRYFSEELYSSILFMLAERGIKDIEHLDEKQKKIANELLDEILFMPKTQYLANAKLFIALLAVTEDLHEKEAEEEINELAYLLFRAKDYKSVRPRHRRKFLRAIHQFFFSKRKELPSEGK